MNKTKLNDVPWYKLMAYCFWCQMLALAIHYSFGFHDCKKEHVSPDYIQTMRSTFCAGAKFSELHHAEIAHYPTDEWLNQAIQAIERGEAKKFLDDFVQKGSVEAPEVTGRVFIPDEGQDSGKESERL